MPDPRLVFVVGAGASKEVGLPTGQELTATIATKVDILFSDFNQQTSGEHEIVAALYEHVNDRGGDHNDVNDYLRAGWRIRDAMPQALSIDSFIDVHQGDEHIELCGKLAIVRSILEAERNSSLHFDPRDPNPRLDFEAVVHTWYNRFMQLISNSCRRDDTRNMLKNISFIIFNYDRCVEHFLLNSLQNYYGFPEVVAGDCLKELKFFHPYGMVGHLPWQESQTATPFGQNVDGRDLLSRAAQIKTFTEQTEDQVAVNEIRELLSEANIVVFLGFAFHQLNMELISPLKLEGPKKLVKRPKRIFATAKGISGSDCDVIRDEIYGLFGPTKSKIEIYLRNDLACEGLFNEFSRSLIMK